MRKRVRQVLTVAVVGGALAVPVASATEVRPGAPTPERASAAEGPQRLKSRPALRKYSCLHRSQAYTGFAEPSFLFTLKAKGVWIDRTTGKRVKGRWTWRKSKATLYSKKGRKIETFAHFRDSSGKYLREHPEPANDDALICR